MERIKLLAGALFSRKWWWATIIVVILMAVFVRLSIWQFDRLAERRAANEILAQALAEPPLPLTAVSLPPDPASLVDRDVTVTGTYDFANQLALKVQNWNGQAGIHLIAPLVFDGGETAVLVDRGWIPDSQADPSQWTQYDTPGPVSTTGYVALSQIISNPDTDALPDGPQKEWYRVDVEAIQSQLPYDLLPVYVIQSPPPEGNVEFPFNQPKQVDLSKGNHLSYAVQWLFFASLLGGGYLIYVNKSLGDKNS